MTRDLSKEGISKFKNILESQYQMLKKGILDIPNKNLNYIIDKGSEYYSQLSPDEQTKYDELKKASDKVTPITKSEAPKIPKLK